MIVSVCNQQGCKANTRLFNSRNSMRLHTSVELRCEAGYVTRLRDPKLTPSAQTVMLTWRAPYARQSTTTRKRVTS
jgi:hypothetical protein